MSDFEEGEVDSGEEEEEEEEDGDRDSDTAPYNPLLRPQPHRSSIGADSRSSSFASLAGATRPRSSTNSSMMVNVGDTDAQDDAFDLDSSRGSGIVMGAPGGTSRGARVVDSDEEEGLLDESSSDGDSSDDGRIKPDKPRRKKLMRLGQREPMQDNSCNPDGGGSLFSGLAAKFQEDRARQGLPTRKRANNVWGSILQEESLTTELTGIGVGRSLKDLDSDRGAETYDYVVAQEKEAERRAERDRKEREKEEKGLDDELQHYWNKEEKMETGTSDDRRNVAIQAGKKRSVKDRLGSRRNHRQDQDMKFEDMSIPQPGVPRTIADLDHDVKVVGTDVELGKDIANKLSEPKTELMVGVLEIVGRKIALDLFQRTQKMEAEGGMMIKCGERRRTPGGVFLQLLRDLAKEDKTINEEKIRHFFAQSNRLPQKRRKKPAGMFKSDLELFKKLNEERKKKKQQEESAKEEMDMDDQRKEEEDEEELKPLPDILTSISHRIHLQGTSKSTGSSASSSCALGGRGEEDDDDEKHPEVFVEPEAPPNSVERVERTLGVYDDDFLSQECETEDLELF